ncbi:hypothetical protein V2J09_022888 [Rumex salicifolius]
MAEDINITKDVKKSKERPSSREKARLVKKQKVGLSVAESSERLYVAKPRRHGFVAFLCSTLNNFNDAQKAAVREMGFGLLFSWDDDALSYILCDWLVGKFDSASGSLRCGNDLPDIIINDLIVKQYLGLPRGHHQFDTSRVNYVQVKSWRHATQRIKL